MNFLELAKSRYSCRHYAAKPIEKSHLYKVLEAGRIAPSAKNLQPWQFVVVDKDKILSAIKSCYQKNWIQSAPCIIVALGNHDQSWQREDGKDHCDIDLSIAIDHMTLAATDAGLATCWVCKFDAKKVSEILNLPDYIEPVALLPIGYPTDRADTERHKKLRKPIDEIVQWNEYKV